MGCSLCKEIIDNRDAVIHQMGCMSTSILLSAAFDGPQPTPAMAAEFKERSEALARCAAAIEAHVNPPKHLAGTDATEGGAT